MGCTKWAILFFVSIFSTNAMPSIVYVALPKEKVRITFTKHEPFSVRNIFLWKDCIFRWRWTSYRCLGPFDCPSPIARYPYPKTHLLFEGSNTRHEVVVFLRGGWWHEVKYGYPIWFPFPWKCWNEGTFVETKRWVSLKRKKIVFVDFYKLAQTNNNSPPKLIQMMNFLTQM